MGSYYLIFFHLCRKIIPKTPAACINDCGRITLVGLTSCLVRLFRRLRRATIICPQAIIAGYIIFHQTRNKISWRFVSSRPCINKLNLPRNLAVNLAANLHQICSAPSASFVVSRFFPARDWDRPRKLSWLLQKLLHASAWKFLLVIVQVFPSSALIYKREVTVQGVLMSHER